MTGDVNDTVTGRRPAGAPGEQELLATVAQATTSLDAALRRLLYRLPAGDVGAVRQLRQQLADAGVREEAVVGVLRRLRTLMSDEDEPPHERLGVGEALACGFCGRVPLPVDLVFGGGASLCRTCASAYSVAAPTRAADLPAIPCAFCAARSSEITGGGHVSAVRAAVVCVDCVALAEEILADS